MKYLEIPAIDSVNNALTHVEFSDCRIYPRIEAYSCKAISSDKKLYKQLEAKYGVGAVDEAMQDVTAHSPVAPPMTPDSTGLSSHSQTPTTPQTPQSHQQTLQLQGQLLTIHGGGGYHPYRKRSQSGISVGQLPSSLSSSLASSYVVPPAPASSLSTGGFSFGKPFGGFANGGGNNGMHTGSFGTSSLQGALPSGSLGTSFEDRIIPSAGPLSFQSSKKTFFFLISTLNSSFPDYDFSNIKPEQFVRQTNVDTVVSSINTTLRNAASRDAVGELSEILQSLWTAIDSAVTLADCEIYSYTSDMETDPYAEIGNIWSFNYFFYGRKLKRVVFFTCRAVSFSASLDENGYPEDSWDDNYVAGEMDDI